MTVGRHAADDDATVHPLVAAALERRAPEAGDALPRHGQLAVAGQAVAEHSVAEHPVAEHEEGPLGWPGEPGDGTGLGWPADTRPAAPADEAVGVLTAEPAARRRGWRRLFRAA
ncbi:hypothetical protein [Modestobacter sp. NPDC049651]|uniref:hypothetical protein n=1 Tax=unclassified Modestobacter TaxID=2643866 RepID=UPI00340AB1F7